MSLMRTLSLSALLIFGLAHADEMKSTKDGRQYMYDLQRRLKIEDTAELSGAFQTLRQNMPKQNTPSSLAGSMDAMAKMAAVACSYSAAFYPTWNDLDGLYKTFLDRAPTDAERAAIVKDEDGNPSYFANCVQLALHPEFLMRK
jgi:hypothetical protein